MSMVKDPEMELEKHTKQATCSWWGQLCNHVKNDDTDTINTLLDKHQQEAKDVCVEDRILSDSPLHTAVLHDKGEILKLLLSRGLDVGVTNLYGETPLHLACRLGRNAQVETLLEAGANIDDKDCGDNTPVFHAVYGGQTNVVDQLIRAGCNLDTLNEELITPLDHAVMHQQGDIISLLLKGGCTIDKTVGLVYYPFHYANSLIFSLCAKSDVTNIEIMINAGYKITYSQIVKLLQVAEQLALDESLLFHVKKLISRPNSLAGCCRIKLRHYLLDKKFSSGKTLEVAIQELPLPSRLKEYLCLR